MGCYMSRPDDKVDLLEGRGKNFSYASASCQGWRREQEDAEICLPYYEDDASLFVVCDGHGGPEVAQYTVAHFPQFLKEHPLYKAGDYRKALKTAFIEFDALLRTKEVSEELNRIAMDCNTKKKDHVTKNNVEGTKENDQSAGSRQVKLSEEAGSSSSPCAPGPSSSSSNDLPGPSSSRLPDSVVEDVDAKTLYEEATIPIEKLIHKYSGQPAGELAATEHKAQDQPDAGCSSSDAMSSSSRKLLNSWAAKNRQVLDAFMSKFTVEYASSDSDEGPDDAEYTNNSDSEDDDDDDDDDDDSEEDDTDESDDATDDDDDEDDEDADADEDDDGDDECEEDPTSETNKIKRLHPKKHRSSLATRNEASSDDSEDDSEADSEMVPETSCSSDSDSESDRRRARIKLKHLKNAEPDDSGDEMKLEEVDALFSFRGLKREIVPKVHRPGVDSGCTAVVALIKGDAVYVASAGDSRCIVVSSQGGCKELSFDHKPEDKKELDRIERAGGQVHEGRVNGGLNLSRALGDFTYKDENLPAKDQMISPVPDVHSANLNKDKVEYLFLACDGIWNAMTSSQVSAYIQEIGPKFDYNLGDMCCSVLRNILAENTDGDGTGCDNMTCILVRLDNSNDKSNSHNDLKHATEAQTEEIQQPSTSDDSSKPKKRSADQDEMDRTDEKQACKRKCIRLFDLKTAN